LSNPNNNTSSGGAGDQREKEQLERQLLQAKKRVPPGFWKETVIRQYVPEVLRLLASRGRKQPTIRRVFYTVAQLHEDFPKTTSGYQALSKHLTDVRLRRKGKDADYRGWDGYDYKLDEFSDDSRSEAEVPRYTRPKRFVQEHAFGLIYVFKNYDLNYWEGQKSRVEIMCEKRTMESTIKDIVKPKQVTVFANSGNDGLSHQVEAYKRWKDYQKQGLDVHVGYAGDLDEWGEYMDKRDYIKKILQMIAVDVARAEEPLNWNWSKDDWDNDDPENKEDEYFENHYDPNKPEFTFERIGLTEDQVDEYGLMKIDVRRLDDIPEDQQKIQHRRFADRHGGFLFTVELDAIAISHEEEFEDMLFEFIDRWHDEEIWKKVQPLISEEVKDKEVKKRITVKKLANDEYGKWEGNKLEFDDEKDLNEILAKATGKESVDDLEKPRDLVPISKTALTDESRPVGERKKLITKWHRSAKQKIARRKFEKEVEDILTGKDDTKTSRGGSKKGRKQKRGRKAGKK
jgi:hypothetical protein